MAVNLTTVLAGANSFTTDIESTDNADTTTGNVAHGLGDTPLVAALTALHANFYVSAWRVTTLNTTNVVAQKTAGGGGVGGNQARLTVMRPYRQIQ